MCFSGFNKFEKVNGPMRAPELDWFWLVDGGFL